MLEMLKQFNAFLDYLLIYVLNQIQQTLTVKKWPIPKPKRV